MKTGGTPSLKKKYNCRFSISLLVHALAFKINYSKLSQHHIFHPLFLALFDYKVYGKYWDICQATEVVKYFSIFKICKQV